MIDVFVSYRTVDAGYGAAGCYELLAEHLGPGRVFRDAVSMLPGEVYPTAIKRALEESKVLIVLIGSNWLTADAAGQRLIDRSTDWVRREIKRGLEREILVVPVLLDDVEPVGPAELPPDIRPLAYCQVARVHHRSFGRDVRQLIEQITTLRPDLIRAPSTTEARAVDPVPALSDHGDWIYRPADASSRSTLTGESQYVTSSLWRRTLAPRAHDSTHERDLGRLRISYQAARASAAILLKEIARSTPDLAAHEVARVDALWETASLVCGTDDFLTPTEAYVLGCAFVVHEAAMGLAAHLDDLPRVFGQARWRDLLSAAFVDETGHWPSEAELRSPPAVVLRVCAPQTIREAHRAHAARLVNRPWPPDAGDEPLLIRDTQLRESFGPMIGDLAASQWCDVEEIGRVFRHPKSAPPWLPAAWSVDPLKLACILRVTDAVHVDGHHAPTFLMTQTRPAESQRAYWQSQERLGRPQLADDRITFSSLRPFDRTDASAWWLALDYLRNVDRELKQVDALLHDLDRPRLAARAVAGVDSPERFSDLFPVRGWRPVDADVQISDVHALVAMIGGEQLYGREPEVAVRELIQNAHDAVLARRVIDPTFTGGSVTITLSETDGQWTLQVCDDGLGMDEEVLVHGLLDFGRTGWRTSTIRARFIGLASGGFRPKGQFGIGFFAIFMLGEEIEVITRRFDGGQTDARRLEFTGLTGRPLLTGIPPSELVPPGTTVRVQLKASPYDESTGIFHRTGDEELAALVQRLAPDSSVPVSVRELDGQVAATIGPFDTSSATAEEIFDRLYPPSKTGQLLEEQRESLRSEFARLATEVLDDTGRRLGLAVLGHDLYYLSQYEYEGVVAVNGLRADEHDFFAGYLDGKPSRASRDRVEFVADAAAMRRWLASQVQLLRDLEMFTASRQIEFAWTFHQAFGELPNDHVVGMTSDGLLTIGGIDPWVRQRDEVFLNFGSPLMWQSRPPGLRDVVTGIEASLPEGCVNICNISFSPIFDDVFPSNRDNRYRTARRDRDPTWQKRWWRLSGNLLGYFLRRVCESWSCDIGDLLAPVAHRNWTDHVDSGVAGVGPLRGFRLDRP